MKPVLIFTTRILLGLFFSACSDDDGALGEGVTLLGARRPGPGGTCQHSARPTLCLALPGLGGDSADNFIIPQLLLKGNDAGPEEEGG